ncbi:RAxF-45 family protein [Bacillus salitolerans]|uniref:RAxF-45 family protein n=1 Tax=Bacillus salitolerans TaxID=1437434 RepID=A0ABW4LMB3_9BACI
MVYAVAIRTQLLQFIYNCRAIIFAFVFQGRSLPFFSKCIATSHIS